MRIHVFRADRWHVTTVRYRPELALIGTLALAAIASACASTGAVPKPFPVPGSQNARPREEPQTGAPDSPGVRGSSRPDVRKFDGYAVAGTALSLRGIRYQNG